MENEEIAFLKEITQLEAWKLQEERELFLIWHLLKNALNTSWSTERIGENWSVFHDQVSNQSTCRVENQLVNISYSLAHSIIELLLIVLILDHKF